MTTLWQQLHVQNLSKQRPTLQDLVQAQTNAAALLNATQQQNAILQLVSAPQQQPQAASVPLWSGEQQLNTAIFLHGAQQQSAQHQNAVLHLLSASLQQPQAAPINAVSFSNHIHQQQNFLQLLSALQTLQQPRAAQMDAPAATNTLLDRITHTQTVSDPIIDTNASMPIAIISEQLDAAPTTHTDHAEAADSNPPKTDKLESLPVVHCEKDGDNAWNEGYNSLCEFKKKHGHIDVPARYPLSQWVMKQRRQYEQLQKGMPSCISPEQIEKLCAIGFVWYNRSDPKELWNIRAAEMEAFKEEHGHCLVPQRYAHNPQLGTWVNTQRRHYKLLEEGKPTSMTPARVERLESIGFLWKAKRGAPAGKRRREKETRPHRRSEANSEEDSPQKVVKRAKV